MTIQRYDIFSDVFGSEITEQSAGDYVRYEEYEKVRADAERYKEQRDNLLAFMENAPVSSGVCCCGDDMTRHSNYSDHSPVDQWDHSVRLYGAEIRSSDINKETTK